jgi:C1A family cysteine protease
MRDFKKYSKALIFLLVLSACNTYAIEDNTQLVSTFSADNGVDLRPFMTKVKDQGRRDTCNAFAATSLMEFLIKKKTGNDIDLSESYNYWAGKKYSLNNKYLEETYKNIDGLAGFLAVEAYKSGSMLETSWKYETQNWYGTGDPRCKFENKKPVTECFTGTPPLGAKLLPYRINPVYIERDKIARFILKEQKPVIINLSWNFDLVGQAGDIRMPTAAELKNMGGHVITLVGYSADSKRFIFRNSYGTSWGNKGYGTIPEEYILKYCEVCPYLPDIATYSPDVKDMVLRTSKGVSGELSEVNSPNQNL